MDSLTHVGMDVHKESTAVALLRPGVLEPDHRVIASTPEAYRRLVAKTGTEGVVFCYEAGPCAATTPTGSCRNLAHASR